MNLHRCVVCSESANSASVRHRLAQPSCLLCSGRLTIQLRRQQTCQKPTDVWTLRHPEAFEISSPSSLVGCDATS